MRSSKSEMICCFFVVCLAKSGRLHTTPQPGYQNPADKEEYADFAARLAPYGISQSEFLRQAIRGATIRPVVHVVSTVNDELLAEPFPKK